MKRFVDIRSAETGYRFAWYDTIFDKFETHGGQQTWDTVAEFSSMYEGHELDRYLGLCPSWAFEISDDDKAAVCLDDRPPPAREA